MRIVWHKRLLKPLFDVVRRGGYIPPAARRGKFRFVGPFDVATEDGLRFRLHNNAYQLESSLYWVGWDEIDWERSTRDIWTSLCRSASTVLDVGANTGIFSVVAKAANPEARVLAFEPQPNVFEVLRTNNAINGYDIRCLNLALSDTAGTLPFYNYGKHAFTSSNTTAGSLNGAWRTEGQRSIEVAVDRLDAVLAAERVSGVDLIKIDVETLEFEVLSGYGERLAADEPIVVLEIQDRRIGDKVASLFDTSAYAFFHIDERDGLSAVSELTGEMADKNYLLCPHRKLDAVRAFEAGSRRTR